MLDHKELIDIAKRYSLDDLRAVTALCEPKVPGIAEIPDVISWNAAMYSTVIDVKTSLADLRADAIKPFRHDRSGMGLYRYLLWEKGGDIRAEHLDDDSGMGGLEYDPATEQVRRIKTCVVNPDARNWIHELAVLNHYLGLATRASGKSAAEHRKSAPKIGKKFHDEIRMYVESFGSFGVAAKAIARDVLKNPKLAKHLASAVRRGEIEGIKADGTPAVISTVKDHHAQSAR